MKKRLAAFPAVSKREYAARRSYQALWERWRAADTEPLRVTGQLLRSHVPGVDGAMHLDSILSAAVFGCSLVGARVDTAEQFVLPLPLDLLWISEDGRPCWAATDLRPVGGEIIGETYVHSRYPGDRAALAERTGALTSAGRYKDCRIPLRIARTPEVEAYALGVRADVEALLGEVSHIGRKPAMGHGRVVGWRVEPAPGIDRAWIAERRFMPLDALGDTPVTASRIAPRTGWTPPYWDARLHMTCRRPAWRS